MDAMIYPIEQIENLNMFNFDKIEEQKVTFYSYKNRTFKSREEAEIYVKWSTVRELEFEQKMLKKKIRLLINYGFKQQSEISYLQSKIAKNSNLLTEMYKYMESING